MLRAIVFGLALGAAVQATRKLPPDGPLTPWGVVLLLIVSTAAGWGIGRARRAPSSVSVATAVAAAEATARADQRVMIVNQFPQEWRTSGPASGVAVPHSVEWMGEQRQQIEDSSLEGMDSRDLEDLRDLYGPTERA